MKMFDIHNNDYLVRPFIPYSDKLLYMDKLEKIYIDTSENFLRVDILCDGELYKFRNAKETLPILRHIRFNEYPIKDTCYDVAQNINKFFDLYENDAEEIPLDYSISGAFNVEKLQFICINDKRAFMLKDIQEVRLEEDHITLSLKSNWLDDDFTFVCLRGLDMVHFALMLNYQTLNTIILNMGKSINVDLPSFVINEKLQYMYNKSPIILQDTFAGSVLGPMIYYPQKEYGPLYPVIPLKDLDSIKIADGKVTLRTDYTIHNGVTVNGNYYYFNKVESEYLIGDGLTTKYWNILDDNGELIVQSTDIDSWDEVFSCSSKTSALESLADN